MEPSDTTGLLRHKIRDALNNDTRVSGFPFDENDLEAILEELQ